MRELVMSGESGIAASARAGSFLSQLGIKFIPRAPQQHARIVERRGALYSAMSFIGLMLNSKLKVCSTYLLSTAWQRLYLQVMPWSR